MSKDVADKAKQKPLVRVFWRNARGFWSAPNSWKVAWLMTACLIALVVGQLIFQNQLKMSCPTTSAIRQIGRAHV